MNQENRYRILTKASYSAFEIVIVSEEEEWASSIEKRAILSSRVPVIWSCYCVNCKRRISNGQQAACTNFLGPLPAALADHYDQEIAQKHAPERGVGLYWQLTGDKMRGSSFLMEGEMVEERFEQTGEKHQFQRVTRRLYDTGTVAGSSRQPVSTYSDGHKWSHRAVNAGGD